MTTPSSDATSRHGGETSITTDDRALVQHTWALAAPHADDVARTFYARLFELDPKSQLLFGATDMDAQRKKLTTMLDTIVRAIDAPEKLIPVSAALGRRHVNYHVATRYYDTVGEALIWTFQQMLGAAFTPAAAAAWVKAYTLLASIMQRGAAQWSDAQAEARP